MRLESIAAMGALVISFAPNKCSCMLSLDSLPLEVSIIFSVSLSFFLLALSTIRLKSSASLLRRTNLKKKKTHQLRKIITWSFFFKITLASTPNNILIVSLKHLNCSFVSESNTFT